MKASSSWRVSLFVVINVVVVLLSLGGLAWAGQPTASDGSALVRLQAATFDPLQGEPPLPSNLRLTAREADEGVFLVQFKGPIQPEWKAALEGAGARVYGYIPDHTLLARLDREARQRVAAYPFVRWVGLYQPGYKLAPDLAQLAQTEWAEDPLTVNIMAFEPAAVASVAAALQGLGGVPLDWDTRGRWGLLRAQLPAAGLATLAQQPEVRWIEPYVAPQLANDRARGEDLMNVDRLHQELGLTGAGQIIGHADTGLDTGALAALHPDLQGRVHTAYGWGRRTLFSVASPGSGPMGLAWDGEYLWNIDWVTDQLYKLRPDGSLVTSCRPSVAVTAGGLAWDGSRLWYAERGNNRLYRLNPATCEVITSFLGPGSYAYGLAWDGTNLWVSDSTTERIYQVNTSGVILKSFAAPGSSMNRSPSSLVWMDGFLWVGDTYYQIIYKVDAEGAVLDTLPIPAFYASGLAYDGTHLWVSDAGLDRIYKQGLTPSGQTDWSDPNGHGTHTAASIVGTGAASGGQYRGVAPGARLVTQSVMAGNGALTGLPLDLTRLFRQAFDDEARVHSNSWGAAVNGRYTIDSAQTDQFMWDYPSLLVVLAAGNEGYDWNQDGVVDADSLDAPGTAKNVLTVGATENARPAIDRTWRRFGFGANPIRDDRWANHPSGLAAFSSRGPTDDGRLKPDVVAPGTLVVSARSSVQPFRDDLEGPVILSEEADPSGAPTSTCQAEPVTHPEPQVVATRAARPLEAKLAGCSGDTTVAKVDGPASPRVAGWQLQGNWRLVTSASHSPSHAFVNANYGSNVLQRLNTPVIDGSVGADVVGFWTRYSLGSDDKVRVAFSDDNFGTSIYYEFTGASNDWTYKEFPIPWGYCWGSNFQFCLTEKYNLQVGFVVSAGNTSRLGDNVYIDDVRVFASQSGLLSEYGLAPWGSDLDEKYVASNGTSMATPLTAGVAALIRQYYVEQRGLDPSAALVKATLIDGATDLTPGQYGGAATGATVFQDDIENGTANWTTQSPWAVITGAAHSPTHSWTDSPNGNYAVNADTALTLNRSFNLSTISQPGFSFWHTYNIEYGYDNGFVEISTNNGLSWTKVLTVTGTSAGWYHSVVDLASYRTAQNARFRFRLKTDDIVNREGWTIDDVAVGAVSFQEVSRRPDMAQGWGRVNAARSIMQTVTRRQLIEDQLSLQTGQTFDKIVQVSASVEPLRVTLVWTDYPSSVEAAVNLVNDLDLVVTGPTGTSYYPNGLTAADRLNPVEGIEIQPPAPGAYRIQVQGHNVPFGPQPFALVISGAVADALPLATVTPTPSATLTASSSPTHTSTPTPTRTLTPTNTAPPTSIPTSTAPATSTPTATVTPTAPPILTPTSTTTPVVSTTVTLTPTATSTLPAATTVASTPTATPSSTEPPTLTPTSTPTLLLSLTGTPTPTATPTPPFKLFAPYLARSAGNP